LLVKDKVNALFQNNITKGNDSTLEMKNNIIEVKEAGPVG